MPVLTYRRGYRYQYYDLGSNMFIFTFNSSGVKSGYESCKFIDEHGDVYFMCNGEITDSDGRVVDVP